MGETYDLGIFQGQLKLSQDPDLKKLNDASKSPAMQKSISAIGVAAAAAVGAGVFEAIVSLAKSSQALSAVFGALFDMLGALIDIIVMANFDKIQKAFMVMAQALEGLMGTFGPGGGITDAGKQFIQDFADGVAKFVEALIPALVTLTSVFIDIFITVFTNPGVIAALVGAAVKMAEAFSKVIIGFIGGTILGGVVGSVFGPAGTAIGMEVGGYAGAALGMKEMASSGSSYGGGAGASIY